MNNLNDLSRFDGSMDQIAQDELIRSFETGVLPRDFPQRLERLKKASGLSWSGFARAVGVDDRLGTLHAGKQADLSILDVQGGDWVVYDVIGDSRKSDRAVTPVMSVKKGQVFEAAWGPRPWGWEPDSA